jgi:hypothetical protein
LETIEGDRIADDFPMYISRQELTRFFVRYELFKEALQVKGSIVECGVFRGAGLMLYAQLSAIFEPFAMNREVIGFDSFQGFPTLDRKDGDFSDIGDFSNTNLKRLQEAIQLFDMNRHLSHVQKVRLVEGDACETIPKFFEENPHTVVALLHLDFDIYEPTCIALEHIVPRMPRGGVLIFDELNDKRWQGETVAVMEKLGLRNLRIRKYPQEPQISYTILE